MKIGKPVIDKKKYSKDVEKKIKLLFDFLLYEGIENILKDKPIYNSNDTIINALNTAKIQYVDGSFSGSFDARISKSLKAIGAIFDSRTGFFNLSVDKMPMEIRQAIAVSTSFYATQALKILDFIDNINPTELIETFSISTDYGVTLTDLDKQIVETLKNDIQVIPEFTEEMKINLVKDYNKNMKLYINNWAEEEIVNLREIVEQNTWVGGRASNLEKEIQKRKKVSASKAKFLARQETSLLVSKYREQRYKSLGITTYQWQTSNDERVREDHKILDGTMQSWDSPPIVDRKTGRTAHAGEDFGCRCVAKPIINE